MAISRQQAENLVTLTNILYDSISQGQHSIDYTVIEGQIRLCIAIAQRANTTRETLIEQLRTPRLKLLTLQHEEKIVGKGLEALMDALKDPKYMKALDLDRPRDTDELMTLSREMCTDKGRTGGHSGR